MEFDAFRMDGLGNDFVIIDQRKRSVSLTKDQIIKICDRNFLGCDQLIFIQNSTISNASMKFYNSDGSTSGACGNGTRCHKYEENKGVLSTFYITFHIQIHCLDSMSWYYRSLLLLFDWIWNYIWK